MKSSFAIIYCLVVILPPKFVSGQTAFISIGGEIAFPGSSQSMSTNAGTGYGGSLRVETLGRHLSAIATIGYLAFAQHELPYSGTPPTTTRFKAIPIQVGMKYYPKKLNEIPKGLFVSAEIGVMPTVTQFNYAVNPDYNFKETGLSCAPGIGYQLGKIESGFRLQYNLTASGFNVYYYNFRLAYSLLKRK